MELKGASENQRLREEVERIHSMELKGG